MGDRVVRGTWWTLVMGFIFLAALAAVYAGYWGVGELVGQRWAPGVGALLIALSFAAAAWLACRHRSDLLYA